MGQISPFLRKIEGGYAHYCPGCHCMHGIAVEKPLANGARWSFDGNVKAPTFNPSINIRAEDKAEGILDVCHYFIRGGQIQFCSDSTHALSGQTVPLPTLPPEYAD